MRGAHYMKLWCADFLGDTLHLTQAEVGQYMLILMAMWNNGAELPNNPTQLRRIARGRVSPAVMDFFTVEDGHLTQPRLKKEWHQTQDLLAKARVNGQAGGLAKALKNNEQTLPDATASALANQSQSQSHNHIESKKSNKKEKSSRANGAPISEDWQPDIADLAWAKEKGYQSIDLKTQTEMMVNWALSNANRAVARKLDWSKTWRNWVMRNLGNRVTAQQQSRTQVAMEELRAKYGNSRPSNGNGDSRFSPEFVHATSAESDSLRQPTHRLVYREATASFEEDGES